MLTSFDEETGCLGVERYKADKKHATKFVQYRMDRAG